MLTKINQSLGLFLLFFLTLASCKNEGRRKADVSNVELKMELLRFDKSLYEIRHEWEKELEEFGLPCGKRKDSKRSSNN